MVIFVCKLAGAAVFNVYILIRSELFPTTVRQQGVGSCNVAARIGSMLASFGGELSKYMGAGIMVTFYACLSLSQVFGYLMLPETGLHEIPDTIEEAVGLYGK